MRSKSQEARSTCSRLTEAHVYKAGTCRVNVVKLKIADWKLVYPRRCVSLN